MSAQTSDELDRASTVIQAPVIDGHNDLPWRLRCRDIADVNLATDLSDAGLHTDVPRLRAGGVSAQFWSVFVPCEFVGPAAVSATLEQIDLVHRFVAAHPADLMLATSADEVEAARASGRVASLIGAEGGHSIGDSLGVLRAFYRLGVRYLTLTHNLNTGWADSATDEPGVGGLNDFGRAVVREMNRLGMLVDLSHVAPSTMHAALDVSTAPAFFSHSSARALCDHVRNVPDDVLTRVRDTEGVVMVAFVPGFLNEECRQWWSAAVAAQADSIEREDDADAEDRRDDWLRHNPRPPCGVRDVVNHIEYIRDVAGVESIGLGGDFDGIGVTPDGLTDVASYPAIVAEMADRGWSDADITKVTWGNALRVLRASEH